MHAMTVFNTIGSPYLYHGHCHHDTDFHMVTINSHVAAPEVYTVIPPQPLEKKPGQLEQWQLDQFFNKGFVQISNFFTKEELQPVLGVRNVV